MADDVKFIARPLAVTVVNQLGGAPAIAEGIAGSVQLLNSVPRGTLPEPTKVAPQLYHPLGGPPITGASPEPTGYKPNPRRP